MLIESNKVVSFCYRLSDEEGKLLEECPKDKPTVYLHGHRNIIPNLEKALLGKQKGDEFSVTLEPALAYGPRNEDSQKRVPIKHLLTKGRLKPGMVVSLQTENGPKQAMIIKVGKFNVDVDTNHPFAGKTLTFDIAVQDVREASKEEAAHGHAHGMGGH